jgi:hypothetical protein
MAAPRPPDRQGSADRGRAMESRPEGENGNSGAPGGDRELAQVRAAGSHEVAGWDVGGHGKLPSDGHVTARWRS